MTIATQEQQALPPGWREEIKGALQTLKAGMDKFVIGHTAVKEALLLALIGREHLYIQGEPGCAKTLLAEITAKTADLKFHFCQLHRDTRLSELIGEIVLERRPLEKSYGGKEGGEIISQTLAPGGMLSSDLVLLDDICRAPGEALNVLLRVLNERKYQTRPIPLMSAIATSNPVDEEYYNEPLDPANLDRFTLQLSTKGALSKGDWEQARQIMDRYDGFSEEIPLSGLASGDALKLANRALQEIKLPRRVVTLLVRLLEKLGKDHNCTPANSLLTDRTMLVKVPKMIKAMALLNGRDEAVAEDLRVLNYILTFRVPEEVYEKLDKLIDEMVWELAEEEQDSEEEGEIQGTQEEEQENSGGGDPEREKEGDNALIEEILETLREESQQSLNTKSIQQQATGNDHSPKKARSRPQAVENMEVLLKKIRGRLERNPAEMETHPGGSPRSWKRMRSFEEFLDTDYVEMAIWLEKMHPNLPRTYHRKKKHMGGKVVIVRDVSQSMEGRYARWTSSVVTKLVELVRKKRMRIGYIEFNHVSHKYQHDGRFFTRDYDKIIEIATNVTCSGVTNYQYPLKDALDEFKAGGAESKHILFLTDGEPTQGDWLVREERRRAKQVGVAIHTLFIGTTECPEILDIISEETDGSRFLATPNEQGGLTIRERVEREVMERLLHQAGGAATPGMGITQSKRRFPG